MRPVIVAWLAGLWLVICTATPSVVLAADAPARDKPDWDFEARQAFQTDGLNPWYNEADDTVAPIALPWEWNWRWPWKWPSWLTFNLFGGAITPLRVLLWTALAAVLLLAIVLVVRVVRARSLSRRQPELVSVSHVLPANQVEALTFLKERSRDDLLGQARRHYQQGDYSEAIIFLFSHQLVELDRFSLIHLARGKTNRQYLREAGKAAPLKQMLERTMTAFESVFFGSQTLDRVAFEACWNQLPEFENQLNHTVK